MSLIGFGNLKAQINNVGDFNTSQSQILAKYPLAVPEGMSSAKYDQKLLESGSALSSQNLGPYNPFGRPLTISANSGNVATQVVLDAGGIFPNTQSFYSNPNNSRGLPYAAPGLGDSVNTLQFILGGVTKTINYTQQKISQVADSMSWSTVNLINETASRISSIINSLKKP